MRCNRKSTRWHAWLIAIITLLTINGSVQAVEKGFFSLQLENDLWGSNDDRFYTHGTKLSFASTDDPPDHLKRIAELLPWYRTGNVHLYGYEIGQNVFTPEDISATNLIENDRPYAGWLYFNHGIAHIYKDLGNEEWMNFLGYTVGVVGPASLAEQTQTLVHEILDGDNPEGWSNQLENEPGINFWYLHKYRRIYNFDEKLQFEIGPHVGFMLGNVYTLASTCIMFRYGTHLKTDIGPPSIAPGFSGAPAFNPNRQSHWYVFAALEARAVARNIFLDGNTWRDSHSIEKNDLVGDLQLGFAYHFNDMRISFVQLFRSKEFEGQRDSTQFGAFNLTFYFNE